MSWRPLLRIAHRDAWRARGRSALIVAMVALPVLALTLVDVVGRTLELDLDQRIERQLGQADARVQIVNDEPVVQAPDGDYAVPADTGTPSAVATPAPGSGPQLPDVATVVPPGSRILTQRWATATVRTNAGLASASVVEMAYDDPMLVGTVRQVEGRAPRTPDEVALTPELAERAGVRVGDRIELTRPGVSLQVVGLALERRSPPGTAMYAQPGALTGRFPQLDIDEGPPSEEWVDSPRPIDWAEVQAMNAKGALVRSRAVLLDPPPREQVPFYATQAANPTDPLQVVVFLLGATLVVGLAVLEVVLLAGAAFAVGVRRRSRELALLAAAGGDGGHVRGVVLAGGGVLGLVGGLVGLLLGIAAAALLVHLPLFVRFAGQEPGRFDLRPLELAAILALGVGTGVLAAALPARTAARQDVVRALSGRRGIARTPRKVPVIGVVLTALGVAAAAAGTVLALRVDAAAATASASTYATIALVAGGALAAEIGLIVLSPAVIGATAALGRRLPLAPRLALRDAARHRGRSAPALAAVLAAVSGGVALTLVVAANDARDRENHWYETRVGQAYVPLAAYEENEARLLDGAALSGALSGALPVTGSRVVTDAQQCSGSSCAHLEVEVPPENRCPLQEIYDAGREPTGEERAAVRSDPRCTSPPGYASHMPVGDADLLAFLTGTTSEEAGRALAAGGVVVGDPRQVRDGRATLAAATYDETTGEESRRRVEVPAAYLPMERTGVGAFLAPEAAQRLGVTPEPARLVLALDRLPTDDEEERANAALSTAAGTEMFLHVERGYVSSYGPVLLALIAGSTVITLGATGVATGLAQADARPDHATLAAVGAAPRMRRVLAMAQAFAMSGLGALLGVAAGLVPALAYLRADPSLDVVLPWPSLLTIALGVPLLAALCAGAFVRSRLPLERRIV